MEEINVLPSTKYPSDSKSPERIKKLTLIKAKFIDWAQSST
jgi:hypothetical protein